MEVLSLTVKQLNTYVRSLLEGDAHLTDVTLVGELSNFKNHYASGHCYFVLKDADAAIRAVMFRGNAARLSFTPQDGLQVACRGYVSVYEKDGTYQFYVQAMQPLRQGDLAAEFERIKNKLQAEGLFDSARKRPLPAYPKSVGIVTSQTGAALQDILNILTRRFPYCRPTLYPALVQGAGAPQSLISALSAAYAGGHSLIIIGRGGGSAEDLSCFNSEALARQLAASPVPTISAVGHETDFTICDFVCDLRAPTPSAAAELAVPDQNDLIKRLNLLFGTVKNRYSLLVGNYERRLQLSLQSRVFRQPNMLYDPFEQRLAKAQEALLQNYRTLLLQQQAALYGNIRALSGLSPLKTLDRGFAAVFKNGKAVSSVKQLPKGQDFTLRLRDGSLQCTVQEKLLP